MRIPTDGPTGMNRGDTCSDPCQLGRSTPTDRRAACRGHASRDSSLVLKSRVHLATVPAACGAARGSGGATVLSNSDAQSSGKSPAEEDRTAPAVVCAYPPRDQMFQPPPGADAGTRPAGAAQDFPFSRPFRLPRSTPSAAPPVARRWIPATRSASFPMYAPPSAAPTSLLLAYEGRLAWLAHAATRGAREPQLARARATSARTSPGIPPISVSISICRCSPRSS